VLGTTRDAARFAVAFPRGVARDGCAIGVFVASLFVGVTSANAGKTSNPPNTQINLFTISPLSFKIPYQNRYFNKSHIIFT
jgi:hypothetical protein